MELAAARRLPQFIDQTMKGHITAARFYKIRANWGGGLLVKGVLDVDEARAYLDLGADGVIISNHGGRQFDAAPTAVELLPLMRARLGPRALLLADGGVRSGLDIARYLALGANFVLLGRPFAFAVAAMGRAGGEQIMALLKAELQGAMAQMGCHSLAALPGFLHR